MFLHIGSNNIIKTKDIISIYNIESMKNTNEYRIIIEKISKNCNLTNELDCEPKSLIITKENNEVKGYMSNISSITLAKRAQLNIKRNLERF